MSRDYKVYLDDILNAIDKIAEFTAGLSRKQFADDAKTCDAVIRNLEVIGEAAKKIPESVRAKSHEIEWKKVAGLRDILIHEYFAVDAGIVWDVVQNKLPELREIVCEMIRR